MLLQMVNLKLRKIKWFAQGCTANWSLEPLTLNLMLFYHPTLTNKILLLCFCNIASVVKILQPPLPWSKINYSLLNRDFYSVKDWGIWYPWYRVGRNWLRGASFSERCWSGNETCNFVVAYCKNKENNRWVGGKQNSELRKLFTIIRLVDGRDKIYEEG